MKKSALATAVTLSLILVGSTRQEASAAIILPGWDLLRTLVGTEFDPDGPGPLGPIPMEGVPLSTYDFGGAIGVQPVGNSDTIVQRTEPAMDDGNGGGTDVIEIELVALSLRSVDPVDFGAGLDTHFVTLSPFTPSLGTMGITFDGILSGTFSSFIELFFDIRIGAPDGPIIFSGSDDLSSTDVPWRRLAPIHTPFEETGALTTHRVAEDPVLIPGVNHLLNSSDISGDFHIGTPEPGAGLLLLASSGLLLIRDRRRKTM